MPLVKKTSSQVLPMASRHSSVVMWLGDEALIVFKQTFLWLVGYENRCCLLLLASCQYRDVMNIL